MVHNPDRRLGTALSRRRALTAISLGLGGIGLSGWLPGLAAAQSQAGIKHHLILLWLDGGPSQLDTFDPKEHVNGRVFRSIQTKLPGVRLAENFPQLAAGLDRFSLIRSMVTQEGDHGRASYLLHTGRPQTGSILWPTLGSLVAHELPQTGALPGFVSIEPFRALSPSAHAPGFLGSAFASLVVTGRMRANQAAELVVEELQVRQEKAQLTERLRLLGQQNAPLESLSENAAVTSTLLADRRAAELLQSAAGKAFDLDEESAETHARYGTTTFAKGCLLARRLVENGVACVECSLAGWDTHADNQATVARLSQILDQALAALTQDLIANGLWKTTTIAVMGEFGRTPKLNGDGRDHWSDGWSVLLGGGTIRSGIVVGQTSEDGTRVVNRPVGVGDLYATICSALGLDPTKTNPSNLVRPVPLAPEGSQPVAEILL